ncbi:GC-rich sequence DNA-binding factor-like domain containing protein [Amanita muscaria]
MARRKRVLDDGDSDSDVSDDGEVPNFENDPDARDEYELFKNPYGRKRRRKSGQDDAIYGVFGEESDDERYTSRKKSDWTKAPEFVSGEKAVDLDKEMEIGLDEKENDSEVDGEDDGSASEGSQVENELSDESQPSRPPSPRVRPEEEEDEELERPRFGGIGSKSASAFASFTKTTTVSEDNDRPARPLKGGIGSKSYTNFASFTKTSETVKPEIPAPTTDRQPFPSSATSTPPPDNDVPTSFGKRSFVRDSLPTKKPVVLSAEERSHFIKLQGSFGAKLLAKMGWQAGTGLGAEGEGIVNPVESKMRPQKMGIAFRGFKEKTEQSKQEARRKGEVVSDDEDVQTKKARRKAKEQEQKKSDVWKRPKKAKTKVEHKTYEQIIAEAGEEPAAVGLGQIIDATGAMPREVSSIADLSISSWTPSTDSTRIPEVRHNIRLIADACKSDLDGLAREANALEERKRYIVNEDARLRKKIDDEAQLIARLQQVSLVANDIQTLSKELSSVYEVSLEPFSPLVYRLVSQFSDELDKYKLDEIIVAAVAPLVRRMVASWNPLQDSSAFVSTFRSWRRALRIKTSEDRLPATELDVYGRQVPIVQKSHEIMTPFESLLWNVWLPKVRTAINNDWSADEPQPAVKLYEVWSTFLPDFIRDNMLDQLILPKVQRAVADWSPKKSRVSLQTIVFPWLPHLGLRMEDVVGDAKRRVKSILKSWAVGQDVPISLTAWKGMFETGDWDTMLLKYVVPKLGATLRDDLRINPRDQKMEPLQQVLLWADAIRPSIFSQLLESEFFPKWLDILHIWLIQPSVSLEEVAQWYSFWKGSFPESVQSIPGVSRGFTRGLQLMNTAMELGPDAPTRLARPDFRAELAAASRQGSPAPSKTSKQRPTPAVRTQEITFRSIVEEFVASHNLLFIPAGRVEERSRMPLYRISPTADGKGGILIYILDDAVWAQSKDDKDDWRAIPLEEMVTRATSGR